MGAHVDIDLKKLRKKHVQKMCMQTSLHKIFSVILHTQWVICHSLFVTRHALGIHNFI